MQKVFLRVPDFPVLYLSGSGFAISFFSSAAGRFTASDLPYERIQQGFHPVKV